MSGGLQARPVADGTDGWTYLLGDNEHVRFFRSVDWSQTLLGLPSGWCLELQLQTIQAFADSRPVCIYWGPERVSIYNEAFILLAGKAHPAKMGSPFAKVYPEIAEHVFTIFREAEITRKASSVLDLALTVERNHFWEETFFDGSFVPITLQNGSIGGIWNSVREKTREVLTDRRAKMCNLLLTPTSQLTSTTVYQYIADCLATNRLDVPFALLWKVEHQSQDGDHDLISFGNIDTSDCGEQIVPKISRLKTDAGFMPILRQAQNSISTLGFDKGVGGINWDNFKWEGHGRQPEYLSVIRLISGDRIYGFLLVANNPLRPIDTDHYQFMSDLKQHVTSAVASTISTEEVAKRNQQLQDQLMESERQIRYMAQHSDIGMMQFEIDGRLIWANEHYQRLIHQDPTTYLGDTFLPEYQVYTEDRDLARNAWRTVLQGEKLHTVELRLQQKYHPPHGEDIQMTIILSAFAYTVMGKVKYIMACMTEVSRLKWAESWQAQMAHNAKEAKRQQSEFTDAISHEVRNPLSAMMQLADSIATSVENMKDSSLQGYRQLAAENVEAASSILACARHQKKILDDVLTLSRMDHSSIMLSPSSIDVNNLIQESLQLVKADAIASAISLQTICKTPLQDVQSIVCDPLRLTQILANLLSNAVKFTKDQAVRDITVTFGLTTTDPLGSFSEQVVWTSQEVDEDPTIRSSWGGGEQVWLTFTVQDTGPGMNSDQRGRMFARFEQANPRTTIKYGGSGLGLFISKSLTQKHGGKIGVSSEVGSGSTFAFFVKARRTTANVGLPERPHQHNKGQSFSSNGRETQCTSTEQNDLSTFGQSHLLLVEDNIVNQKIMRKQLERAGCVVHVANHGLEALAFLRTTSLWKENNGQGSQVDVLLMDWEMPVMDGITCTQEIRSLEEQGLLIPPLRIIGVTANVRQEQIDTAQKAGMSTVLPKPFIIADLLKLIANP